MKMFAFFVAGLLIPAAAAVPARANPTGVHAEKFSCTRCHVGTPSSTATREEATLVMPVKELCATCHES